MRQFAKILNTEENGQVAAILFAPANKKHAVIEFTFWDSRRGLMSRHDLKFESKYEGVMFFHNLEDDNFKIVEKKVIRTIKNNPEDEEKILLN